MGTVEMVVGQPIIKVRRKTHIFFRWVPVFWEALRIALFAIWANKLRSFLTLIGVIIGVSSVMIVGAMISGMEVYVTENITSILGSNSFLVSRIAGVRMNREQWEKKMRTHKNILKDDYQAVQQNSKLAREVAITVFSSTDLRREDKDIFDTQMTGCTANLPEVSNVPIGTGRFLVNYEVERARPVCVIGYRIQEEFFPTTDPIGKQLKVKGIDFTIVGVVAKRGSFMGQSLDNTLYIPYTIFQKIFGLRRGLSLRVKTDPADFEAAQGEVRQILREARHLGVVKEDDFDIMSTDEVNEGVSSFAGAVAAVVVPITAIFLLVGGIVIMNIMMVSVTERTKEIGIRKAIGARRKDLLLQFLLESATLGILGGAFGVVFSYLLCSGLSAIFGFSLKITLPYILLSLGVSCAIGIVAGMWPAFKAAKLDPIVALTIEN